MKCNLSGAAAILFLVIGCAAVKPPAIPVRPPLTSGQYIRIQRGMTYDEVVAIVGPPQIPCTNYADSKGVQMLCSWYSIAQPVPVPVPTTGIVKVVFANGRVVKKSQQLNR